MLSLWVSTHSRKPDRKKRLKSVASTRNMQPAQGVRAHLLYAQFFFIGGRRGQSKMGGGGRQEEWLTMALIWGEGAHFQER